MHSGNGLLLTVGDTIVSEHMATLDPDIDDIEVCLLGFEQDWKKRVIKETIAINKLKPNLNGTDGFHISAIFDPLPSALARETIHEGRDSIHDVTDYSNFSNVNIEANL